MDRQRWGQRSRLRLPPPQDPRDPGCAAPSFGKGSGNFCPHRDEPLHCFCERPQPGGLRSRRPHSPGGAPSPPSRAAPGRTEPHRTGPRRAVPLRTEPHRELQSRAGPSRNWPSRADRDQSGPSGAVPAARLAGRRGDRQSPARAGPGPAGNPSPARPDWKSPAGCAGWAGPGLLSLTVMRRQIWAGAGPRSPPPRHRSRPAPERGMPVGLPGKRLALNGARLESQRGRGPAPGDGTDVLRDRPGAPGPAPVGDPPPSAPVRPGQPFAPSTTKHPGRGAAQSC